MVTTAKKSGRKLKAPLAARKRRQKAKTSQAADLAADLAARKKIGKTLDLQAFRAFHKSNTVANAAHWASEE